MPIIRLDKGIQLMVPKEQIDYMEDTRELTEALVNFLNDSTDDYAISAGALAFSTLLFLRAIREINEKSAEEARENILEIISEGR